MFTFCEIGASMFLSVDPCSPPSSLETQVSGAVMTSFAPLELKSEKKSAHSDYIRSVAFSPDGKTIVSGSDDKTIKVWDAGRLAPKSTFLTQN